MSGRSIFTYRRLFPKECIIDESTVKNSISNDICMCGNAFRSDTHMDVQSRTVVSRF